jgi:hypothetical protein
MNASGKKRPTASKPHRPLLGGTKGPDVWPDFNWDKKPRMKETAPARGKLEPQT